MAHRWSHSTWAGVLGTILVAATAHYCRAQVVPSAPPPPSNPSAGEAKTAANKPPAKELSKQQIDELVEKVFGRDSEQRTRSIRVWLPNFSMVLAAKEVGDLGGRTVRFHSASAAVVDPDDINSKATLFHGEEIVITLDGVLKQLSELKGHSVTAVDIHNQQKKITLRMGVKESVGNVPRQVSVSPAETPNVPRTVDVPVSAVSETVAEAPKKDTRSRITALGLQTRFQFDLSSSGSISGLLPAPPRLRSKPAVWTNEDLTKVPEATFGEPISKAQSEIKAMEETAHVLAKINHVNRQKTDGFLHALLAERADLQGLPFLMGDQCRTRADDAKVFARCASLLRQALAQAKADTNSEKIEDFWEGLGTSLQLINVGNLKEAREVLGNASHEQINRIFVAALMQMLMPEPEKARLGLAKFLATVPNVEATKALARLAIFSAEESVRSAALTGLKLRRERDYTEVLLQGFRYPLPVVSKRAAEALVKLECKDLLPNVIAVLEQPDPRLPVTEKRDGKEVPVVHELVRVNHSRNCMLCHAPGNTENTPEGVLKAAVPLPNVPLPKPSEGGGYEERAAELPDTVVRIDMTYLRQDFSLMMPVSDSHPWPDMQRFDFLVRTRVLTQHESDAYRQGTAEEPGQQSPYHRAALYALRELTGRDTEPTPVAWRKLLQIQAAKN